MSDYTRRQFGRTIAGGAVTIGRPANAAQPSPTRAGSLTDVPGISVGHYTDPRRPTGCSVILFNPPAIAAVDYDGSAPGESQAVLLQPVSPVDRIHALFLTGGGPFALPASGGVLRFFEERKVGFDWGTADVRIPIVVSAVGPTPPGRTRHARPPPPPPRPKEMSAPGPARPLARCTVRAA